MTSLGEIRGHPIIFTLSSKGEKTGKIGMMEYWKKERMEKQPMAI
jgi:hypothetical protein